MDHSMHEDMPGMGDHDEMCSMAMLFTWNYKNTCVVSSKWHIKTVHGMFLSCIAIAFISYLYEYLKFKINHYKVRNKLNRVALVSSDESQDSASVGFTGINRKKNKEKQMKESMLYGLQIFYSFMLMLVFMTYNGWLMISVVVGAIVGHFQWAHLESSSLNSMLASEDEQESSMACH
ncbi:hypothetical protein ACO0RG_002258 [Hanseniaspora osmophila]